jgi:hypothetical protein
MVETVDRARQSMSNAMQINSCQHLPIAQFASSRYKESPYLDQGFKTNPAAKPSHPDGKSITSMVVVITKRPRQQRVHEENSTSNELSADARDIG